MAVPSLVIASANRAKLAILGDLVGDQATLSPLPQDISLKTQAIERSTPTANARTDRPPRETAFDGLPAADSSADELADPEGFVAIARAKACLASALLGPNQLVVATDGGLVVPGLGRHWRPTHTHRFAGATATDHDRAERLLALTARLRGEERRLFWREALVVARDGRVCAAWEATSGPGLLARDYRPARDGDGFWISGLWICPDRGRRLAELPRRERTEAMTHWRQLGANLRAFLGAMSSGNKG